MPKKNNSQEPPKVMTWAKALPILALSLIFDATRLLFEMFWFFGPALAAIYCTTKASDIVGAVVGGALCSVGAGVVGFYAAGPIAAFGVIMAIAVGLFGWMTIGLILIMTNARLFSDHAGHSLWFVGSLLVSEVPFIGALPAITVSVARMYHAQIKSDKAALAAYEKAQAEEQNRNREQQAAQLMQNQQAQVAEQNQIMQEQATNEEEYGGQEKDRMDGRYRAPEEPISWAGDTDFSALHDALSELNNKKDRTREENIKLSTAMQIMERQQREPHFNDEKNDPVLLAAFNRVNLGQRVFRPTYEDRNGFKFSNSFN